MQRLNRPNKTETTICMMNENPMGENENPQWMNFFIRGKLVAIR